MRRLVFSVHLGAGVVSAGAITAYTDRTVFNTANGATTVEDFGTNNHFPIAGLTLDSSTNQPGIGIIPGFILPGVTYSVSLAATP